MHRTPKRGRPRRNDASFKKLLAIAIRLQKQVRYTDELLTTVQELRSELSQADKYSPSFFRARAIISEVMYYFGQVDEARKVVEDVVAIAAVLDKEDLSTLKNRKLVREKVRCFQAFVIAKYYHEQMYEEAKTELEKCRNFVEKKLASDKHAIFGLSTLGVSEYYLGRTYRQLGDCRAAEQAFMTAIRYFVRRAEHRKTQSTAGGAMSNSVRDDLAFLDHKVAICSGLGLAWIDYTQARLTDAEQKVTIAKASLLRYEDDVDNAYLDLILGSIIRCKAAGDLGQLIRAVSLVESARDVFIKLKHGWYVPRATFELGQIHLALARKDPNKRDYYLNLARVEAQKVQETSTEMEDWRWVANSLVLQSEIERTRPDYDEAKRLATDALNLVRERSLTNSLRVCEINALIARAEADLYFARAQKKEYELRRDAPASLRADVRSRMKKALYRVDADLNEVLNLNESTEILRKTDSQNSRIEALCHLYLARCYAYDGDKRRAEASFQKWLGIEGIEHAKIHSLAANVRREINEVITEFVIPGDGNLRYEDLLHKLQDFLLEVARQKYPKSKAKQAELLGVPRMTIHNWITKREKERQEGEMTKKRAAKVSAPGRRRHS